MQQGAIEIRDIAQTEWLASKLANELQAPATLLLYGDLGAGKTTLARSLIQKLSGAEIEVPSPTFTLVQQYETTKGMVSHYDLYRLKSADELFELGWDDAVAEDIVIVEWPERLGAAIPRRAKKIYLMLDTISGVRTARLEGFDEAASERRDTRYE